MALVPILNLYFLLKQINQFISTAMKYNIVIVVTLTETSGPQPASAAHLTLTQVKTVLSTAVRICFPIQRFPIPVVLSLLLKCCLIKRFAYNIKFLHVCVCSCECCNFIQNMFVCFIFCFDPLYIHINSIM